MKKEVKPLSTGETDTPGQQQQHDAERDRDSEVLISSHTASDRKAWHVDSAAATTASKWERSQ